MKPMQRRRLAGPQQRVTLSLPDSLHTLARQLAQQQNASLSLILEQALAVGLHRMAGGLASAKRLINANDADRPNQPAPGRPPL